MLREDPRCAVEVGFIEMHKIIHGMAGRADGGTVSSSYKGGPLISTSLLPLGVLGLNMIYSTKIPESPDHSTLT